MLCRYLPCSTTSQNQCRPAAGPLLLLFCHFIPDLAKKVVGDSQLPLLSKHSVLLNTSTPFSNSPLALATMLHLQNQRLGTCAGGIPVCCFGAPDMSVGYCAWHRHVERQHLLQRLCHVASALPGAVCNSRYLSCWYLLTILLQLVGAGRVWGRGPSLWVCQHRHHLNHPGCDSCTRPAPST